MVLQALVDPESARRNPLKIVLLSALFASVAVGVVLWLKSEASDLLLMVFVLIPSIPLVLNLISYEEKTVKGREGKRFLGSHTLARHSSTIIVLFAFFIGLTAAFTFWYLVLPPNESAKMFSIQFKELQKVRGAFSAYAVEVRLVNAFEIIFLHNLEVLFLVLGFSLLYGAGAVFILAWNASVIAVFLGEIAKSFIPKHAVKETALITGLGVGVFGILPHAIFELLAYSTGALAGGILSCCITSKKLASLEFIPFAYDVAKLVGWAVLFLAVGALIESTGVIGV